MGCRRARLWALFQCCIPKAKAKTRKNLASAQVLEAERPEELATSTEEELNVCREQLLAREEEIALLNAERNNTRLLLEHLEFLVSRYTPSLQTTVGKWQAQSPAGMTSELEVLKSLKILFEHHKALDKKVPPRVRVTLERCSLLEELGATHNKLMILKEKNNLKKILMDRVLDVNHKQENMPSANGKRTRDEDLAQVVELKEIIEKKSREQREMRDRLAALSAHVTELEKDLDMARKDLLKSKEVNMELQQDVREAMAQKEDMEKRITTLEKRYLAAQCKAISVHNLHDKLENEIANKDSMHRQKEDKDRQLQECLELAEQKLQQMLTEVVAELAQPVAALSKSELLSSGSSATKEAKLLELTSQLRKEERVQPLKDQDWEREQQASVLANVGQLFETDKGVSDGEGDRVTLFSMPALLSPRGEADAKTPARKIQKQLDRINEESWFIHRDKENTGQRAEGIESRVGSGSFSNLRRFNSSSSLNLDPASSHAGSFPPSRGRSMPERRQQSPEPEEDKLGFMTLLPAIQEEVEDDTIKCETSTSASLRSFRLARLTGSLRTASDEDIRDAFNATGSQDGPGGNPSNSNSSQKAPKKKGIKSSIGRWFGKKEKSRPGHTSKEALGPVAGRMFTASATWKAPGNADN
ncbi:liprin-alpha-1-like [Ovis canadensis]|uniref:liprin-alpha-1-like n=1 Tax=Ovis canadensis TaxID=37174 RepID=UPI0037513CD4